MSIKRPDPEIKPPRTSTRIMLPEPIVVARFWKSPRSKAQHVRVDLSEYMGHVLLNIRVWSTGPDGIDRPTPKGIALGIPRLPELASAITKAIAKVQELGLIAGDHDDDESTS